MLREGTPVVIIRFMMWIAVRRLVKGNTSVTSCQVGYPEVRREQAVLAIPLCHRQRVERRHSSWNSLLMNTFLSQRFFCGDCKVSQPFPEFYLVDL